MESGCGDDAEQHVGVLRVDLEGDGLGHIGFSNSTFSCTTVLRWDSGVTPAPFAAAAFAFFCPTDVIGGFYSSSTSGSFGCVLLRRCVMVTQ